MFCSYGEDMVLHLLNLLKCHMVLAINDKSVNDLLGSESKEIRKLLIRLIDLPLSQKMHQVSTPLCLIFSWLLKHKTLKISSINFSLFITSKP